MKKDGGGKKEEDVVEVKVDMHCVGCARKVKRAVKGLHGVERVKVDSNNSKMKVVGTIDPWTLKEFLEAYINKKVDFVSPKDPSKKKPDAAAAGDAKKRAAKKMEDNESEHNTKLPPVSTVMLKILLHCEGCIYRIRKAIYKFKGVDEVTIDKGNDLVIVKGTMDGNSLPPYLKEKLNIDAVIKEPKREGKEVGEKEKEKGGDGGAGGRGGKKEKEKEKNSDEGWEKKGGEGDETEAVAASSTSAEVNKYEYYGYRMEMTHPTQLFSDENPNACSIM